jgi:hypothetical protein
VAGQPILELDALRQLPSPAPIRHNPYFAMCLL